MRPWPRDVLPFGGDYNPEQWPEPTWTEDIELMRRAAVSFVSLAIFSWSWLEPADGQHEFGWLDRVMGLLADAGIAVDLATATASPPMWLSAKHPEIAPVDHDGRRLWPGSRQAWCPSSATFTSYATRLAGAMARRYHEHPALAMWHVSNEYGCHNTPCYCDTCAAGFRTWLQGRYGELAQLNEAWGTSFWSQRYTAWEQVIPPRLTPTFANPGQRLDYKRYQSDALLQQYLAERDVLREHSPGVPVTTNFMTMRHFTHLDYHRWAAQMNLDHEVVSTDHYVVDALDDPWAEQAFCGDLTRGIAAGRPWILMEHSSSAVNWQPVNRAKPPGQLLRDSLTHVAHGADAVGFFQWRASRAGAEKFHSGLVPHAGEDSRIFREVCELGAVAARLGEVVGSLVEADVAILWDYEAGWGVSGPALPSALVSYPDQAVAFHRALRERQVSADVVHPSADLTGYRLIVVPTLYLVSDATVSALEAAAAAGAHVVVTYFSGIVDERDHVRLGGYPGAFRELLGVRVSELLPLRAGETVALSDGSQSTVWSEDLTTEGATMVTSYAEGPLTGQPALTRYDVAGTSRWYVSTSLDRIALGALVESAIEAAEVRPAMAGLPHGVDATRRVSGTGSWVFLVNTTEAALELAVDGYDLVSDRSVVGTLRLGAGATAVIREG